MYNIFFFLKKWIIVFDKNKKQSVFFPATCKVGISECNYFHKAQVITCNVYGSANKRAGGSWWQKPLTTISRWVISLLVLQLKPFKPRRPRDIHMRILSIHLLKECWENLKKDQRIIPFDHFLNSHTLFSQWCTIAVRRKSMLVTFGSERVKLAENWSLRPRALVSSLPKPCSALMLREGRLAAAVFAALGSEIGGVAVSHVSPRRLSPRLATS